MESTNSNPYLPIKLFSNVAENLDAQSLVRLSCVSVKLGEIANSDHLWKSLFPKVSLPEKKIKQYICENSVYLSAELEKKVTDFIAIVPATQPVKVQFIFPFNNHKLKMYFGCCGMLGAPPRLTTHIFVKKIAQNDIGSPEYKKVFRAIYTKTMNFINGKAA